MAVTKTNKDESESKVISLRMRGYIYDELYEKARASGLDMCSYIKLLIMKAHVGLIVKGRLADGSSSVEKLWKKEQKGLGVAEGHALRALSDDYNPILAVNELWVFNPGWTKRLIMLWCDKYDVEPKAFAMTKHIAISIIKAYFEIEDFVDRKKGFTRGRYKLKPNYSMRDVDRLEKDLRIKDAKIFDNLIKKVEAELDEEERKNLEKLKSITNPNGQRDDSDV